ncbi:MAG TPA: hypothetical protein VH598_00545, partial [Verrucomicrobiae bacterium]|nr:hypothetical protein [Verrucomicrobiae bacterium]
GQNKITHAAIQTEDGKWRSKLGDFEDIEHNLLSSLEGTWYGTVTSKFLKRPRQRSEQRFIS